MGYQRRVHGRVVINGQSSDAYSIYGDDTTEYGCTSANVDHQSLAYDLSADLNQTIEWGKSWLVSFNAGKTKLVSFHHHRANPDFGAIRMGDSILEEAPCLERLLGLKFTPDLKWNSYIASVAKEASKMIGSLYRSREYLTPSSILYLYKSQIRPTMEYCCHIWAGASRTSLKSLDGVQKGLRRLVGDELFSTLQPLSHR